MNYGFDAENRDPFNGKLLPMGSQYGANNRRNTIIAITAWV